MYSWRRGTYKYDNSGYPGNVTNVKREDIKHDKEKQYSVCVCGGGGGGGGGRERGRRGAVFVKVVLRDRKARNRTFGYTKEEETAFLLINIFCTRLLFWT